MRSHEDNEARIDRGFFAVIAILLAIAVLRAWRAPNAYATAHWLFSYAHGFIPRGLVGTVARPVIHTVGPRVAYLLIAALSAALVAGFFAAAIRAAARIMRRNGPRSHLGLVPLAFVCTPAVAITVHCVGYFDAGLFLLAIVAMRQIERGRYAVAGLASAVGVLTHELYLAVGLPAVGLAMLAKVLLCEAPAWREVRRGAIALGPPLVAAAAVLGFGSPGREALSALEAEVLSLEVVRYEDAPWLFVPWEESLAEAHARMRASWAERSLAEIAWDLGHHLPFIALVLTSVTMGLERRAAAWGRRMALIAGAVAVIVAPLALHLVAWDLHRIDAFCGVAALLVWLAIWPALGAVRLAPLSARWGIATIAVAAFGLSSRPGLFDHYEVALYPRMIERIPEEARKLRRPLAYRDLALGAPVFPNADFEWGTLEGWTRHGDAFPEAPFAGEPWLGEGRPAIPEGRYWMGSARHDGSAAARGRLISVPFTVVGDTIAFKLGAATVPDRTYVAFLVAGEEVARYWSRTRHDRMDLVRFDARAYRGASMTIEVVDDAIGAHVHVDGFRWVD